MEIVQIRQGGGGRSLGSHLPRLTAVVAAIVITATAGQARAGDQRATPFTVAQARPWGVSLGVGGVFWATAPGPAFASLSLNAERILIPRLAVEAGVARGLTTTVGSTNGPVRVDPELVVRAMVKPTLALDSAARYNLFAGVGPQVLLGRAYDGLWHAHTEVGFQFRSWIGFSFVYAIFVDIALNQRPPAVSPAACVLPVCEGPVTAGARSAGTRIAIGYTF